MEKPDPIREFDSRHYQHGCPGVTPMRREERSRGSTKYFELVPARNVVLYADGASRVLTGDGFGGGQLYEGGIIEEPKNADQWFWAPNVIVAYWTERVRMASDDIEAMKVALLERPGDEAGLAHLKALAERLRVCQQWLAHSERERTKRRQRLGLERPPVDPKVIEESNRQQAQAQRQHDQQIAEWAKKVSAAV
jgi:hypothetical protein